MNDFELFMNFGAVVEIRKNYRDDLYNFVKLMLSLGFMNEEITYFINSMKVTDNKRLAHNLSLNEKLNMLEENYTDNYFWNIVDINEGNTNRICIEYQIGKGFTFGKKEDYVKYDETIKILNIEDLIRACNKQDLFNLDFTETSFLKELTNEKDNKLAVYLTDFCEWYEWQLVKYSNGLYNILDLQTKEFDTNENVKLRDCIERVFYRMVDYFTDEGEHEEIKYTENEINAFIELGKQYKLYNEKDIERLKKWLEEEKKYLNE